MAYKNGTVRQATVITSQTVINKSQVAEEVALFNPDGTPFTGGGLTGQELSDGLNQLLDAKIDGVVTPVTAPDAVVASGSAPTKVEYDAVVAEVNQLKAKFNALLTAFTAV